MEHRWVGNSKAKSPLAPLCQRGVGGILLLTLGFIIACGAAATSTPQPTATQAAPGAATPAPGVTPQAAPRSSPTPGVAIKRGGVIAMQDYAVPITARTLHESTFSGMKNMSPLFNQLIEYNPETDDPDDLRGDLARSWELAPDGVSYTFHLHETARWWDGSPVTADDVVFSLTSIVDPDRIEVLKGQSRPQTGILKGYYEGSRAIDPYTVEIKTKFSAPGFLPMLAVDSMKIMPKDWVLAGHIQGLHKPEDLMGSGPFKHVRYTKDVSNEYVKNNDYFKEGYPRIDGMKHFIIVDHGTVMAAFKAGQVLMTNSLVSNLSNAEATQLEKDTAGKLRVHWAGPVGMTGVIMNVKATPYDDARVRRAIYLALHRQPMIQTFSLGMDTLGLPFPPGTWYGKSLEEAAQTPGFRELNGEKHPLDIAEARRLLAEADFPNGFRTTLTTRTVVEFVDLTAVVADQLKRFLNIDATIRTMESAAGQAAYLAGDYEIAVQGASDIIPDPDGVYGNRYIKGALIATWMQWVHPMVQELYDEQVKELDRVKRRALIQKAEDILLHEDNAHPGLYWTMRSWVVDNRIKNLYVPPSINIQLKHEHIWCDGC